MLFLLLFFFLSPGSFELRADRTNALRMETQSCLSMTGRTEAKFRRDHCLLDRHESREVIVMFIVLHCTANVEIFYGEERASLRWFYLAPFKMNYKMCSDNIFCEQTYMRTFIFKLSRLRTINHIRARRLN